MKKHLIYKLHFECTTFRWHEIDNSNPNSDAYSYFYYADKRSQAKYKFFQDIIDSGDYKYYERKEIWCKIRVRRIKGMDLIFSEKQHIGVIDLSPEQIDKMKHACGFDFIKPFYRNRYQTEYSSVWESLIRLGYAYKERNSNLNYYFLTEAGLMIMSSLKPKLRRNLK